jgi:hypothetical protein
VHEIEVSRGLNQVGADPDLCALLDDGFEILDASRIYFSGKINWIDISIKLSKAGIASQSFVVTYGSLDNELIAVSRTQRDFARAEGTLPFALDVESHTMNVVSTEQQMSRLETRRDLFTRALMAALLPVLGSVSPVAAATTTPYTSTPQTCTNKTTQSPKGTSGLTTPNDQDTRPDTSNDDTQDCNTDSQQDTRNDP